LGETTGVDLQIKAEKMAQRPIRVSSPELRTGSECKVIRKCSLAETFGNNGNKTAYTNKLRSDLIWE
jgi:hypothetical protein